MAVFGPLLLLVAVFRFRAARVVVLVDVPVGMRVAVGGAVGVNMLVSVDVLVFVGVHRDLLVVP